MNTSRFSIWKRALAALAATIALSTGVIAADNHDGMMQTPTKRLDRGISPTAQATRHGRYDTSVMSLEAAS